MVIQVATYWVDLCSKQPKSDEYCMVGEAKDMPKRQSLYTRTAAGGKLRQVHAYQNLGSN